MKNYPGGFPLCIFLPSPGGGGCRFLYPTETGYKQNAKDETNKKGKTNKLKYNIKCFEE